MTTSTPIEEISDDMLRDLFTTEQITPQRYMEEMERRESGSKKIEDGGPAFPLAVPTEFQFAENGMSLRDYTAIHSDVPWNAAIETLRLLGNENPTIGEIVAYRAKVKYAEADAMLAARKSGGEA